MHICNPSTKKVEKRDSGVLGHSQSHYELEERALRESVEAKDGCWGREGLLLIFLLFPLQSGTLANWLCIYRDGIAFFLPFPPPSSLLYWG